MIERRAAVVVAVLCATVALAGCASPPPQEPKPADRQLDQYSDAGRQAFAAGRYDVAVSSFEQALQRAYIRTDDAAAADAAYNLAATLSRQRQFDAALARLVEARDNAPGDSADRRSAIDRLHIALLIERERYDEAEPILAAALQRGDLDADTRRALRLYEADIAVRRGDTALAEQRLAAMTDIPSDDPTAAMILGRYARLRGEPKSAADRFLRAAELLRRRLDYPAMVRALAAAAEARAEQGEPASAAELWFRAARSAQLQGFADWADDWSARARAAADEAGATDLIERLDRWRRRVTDPPS